LSFRTPSAAQAEEPAVKLCLKFAAGAPLLAASARVGILLLTFKSAINNQQS